MKPEDYDAFIADPTQWLLNNYLPRINEEFAEPGSYRASAAMIKGGAGMVIQTGQMMQAYSAMGATVWHAPRVYRLRQAPFDTLGDTLRGLSGIMMDIHRRNLIRCLWNQRRCSRKLCK